MRDKNTMGTIKTYQCFLCILWYLCNLDNLGFEICPPIFQNSHSFGKQAQAGWSALAPKRAEDK